MRLVIRLLSAFVFSIALLCSGYVSASVPSPVTVIVADFGLNAGATSPELVTINAGKTASEYIIFSLTDSKHFEVVERSLLEKQIKAENLDSEGLVDPDSAKRLGELLGAKHLIYGNVTDVSLSSTGAVASSSVIGGMGVKAVKAHITLRMMDVSTGDIIMITKGEGYSKSTLTMVGKDVAFVTIGTEKVTQDAVNNALQKAAQNAVDILVERLYGVKKK